MNNQSEKSAEVNGFDISISKAVISVSEKSPKKPALFFMNKTYSYSVLADKIRAVAASFSYIGVKRGDRVLVCLPNIPQAVYVLYGLNRIGAVGVFVSPLSGEREFTTYIKKCRCRFAVALDTVCERIRKQADDNFIIVATSVVDEAGAIAECIYKAKNKTKLNIPGVMSWRDFLKCKSEENQLQTDANDTAVIIFSGGTTGTPKAVEITNINLNALAVGTETMCGRSVQGVRMLSVLPVFHGFGMGITIHTTLFFGSEVLLVPRFEKESTADLILRKKPHYIACVPSMLKPLMSTGAFKKADLSFLHGVFSGGDSLDEELKAEFDAFLQARSAKISIRQGYGATECVAAVALMPDSVSRPESCGLPYPDTRIKIVTPNSEDELPCGESGEICVSGGSVMKGYFDDEPETFKVLRKHSDGRIWLHTGDSGYMDKDGYLYFKERIKRVIVSNGFNIYPSFIEKIVLKNRYVCECSVVGVADPVKQQTAVVFVKLKDSIFVKEEAVKSIWNDLEKELSLQTLPRYLFVSEGIPKTPLGKTDYQKLTKIAEEKIKTAE